MSVRCSAIVAVAGVLSIAPLSAQMSSSPSGWTALFDVTGRCSYAVPPDWKIDGASESANPFAASPDGRVSATLTWSPQASARQTADLRDLAHAKTIHEDSVRRFWMEIVSPPPLGVLHIAVTPSGTGHCMIEIIVSDKSREEARRMVPAIIGTLTSVR
jgi:hypothetical protein